MFHVEVQLLQIGFFMYAVRVRRRMKGGLKIDFGNRVGQIQNLGFHLDLEACGPLENDFRDLIIIIGRLICETVCLIVK